jgi:hypothetical protein
MAKVSLWVISWQKIIRLLRGIWSNHVVLSIKWIFRKIIQLCTYLKRHPLYTTIFLWLILVSFIAAGYLLPIPIPFEGNLIVDRISFIAKQPCILFNKVKIDEITLKGKQVYTFNGVKGDFNSSEEPQLQKLENLTVQLEDEESYLTITSISNQTSFELSELVLQKATQIHQLAYSPERHFHVELNQAASDKSTDDHRPVHLNIGTRVRVSCKGKCSVLDLKLSNRGSFIFEHQAIGDFQPLLTTKVILDVKLHNSDKKPFFGNIIVDKVRFVREQENLNDNSYSFSESAILSGVIRIAGQNLDLKKEQFLLLGWQDPSSTLTDGLPDIQKLRYVHVVYPEESKELQISDDKVQLSESSSGIEVGISGETSRLAVGINPYIPIKIIQGNFFSRLPNDVMNFLNIFFAALFGSLLTWLFDKLPKK